MRALLVNPWVYDFKAFDFWNKPIGLLIVARILRKLGFTIDHIDCMDRLSPYFTTETKTDQWGRGKYHSEIVEKPVLFKHVLRRYKRYGIPRDTFIDVVKELKPPDVIFVTSAMTYWYPGVFENIRLLKTRFPRSRIFLGGIYATLCEQHARAHSGADTIVTGPAEQKIPELLRSVSLECNTELEPQDLLPDYSLYKNLNYGVVLTSRGCPFDCTYCATKVLCERFQTIPNSLVEHQIKVLSKKTDNIAFFDDALLYNKEFVHLLGDIVAQHLHLNLHASNGLHCRYITKDIAQLMFKANFKTMYLSLETTNPDVQRQTGGKVNTEEFMNAVDTLFSAGFTSDQIHVYILYGMPDQEPDDMIDSIELCQRLKVHPHLCEFSPIPHTKEFARTGFTEDTDPLFHNNLFYTWFYPKPKTELYNRVKKLLSKKI
ncbi:radical SAM protein [candidate division WOR-3 bacterium]|nr:radical SAM protein [candidate division WOR-3 bacterium]